MPRGRRQKTFTKGRGALPHADHQPFTLAFIFAGGHSLQRYKEVMQAAGARESGIIGGIQDALRGG